MTDGTWREEPHVGEEGPGPGWPGETEGGEEDGVQWLAQERRATVGNHPTRHQIMEGEKPPEMENPVSIFFSRWEEVLSLVHLVLKESVTRSRGVLDLLYRLGHPLARNDQARHAKVRSDSTAVKHALSAPCG